MAIHMVCYVLSIRGSIHLFWNARRKLFVSIGQKETVHLPKKKNVVICGGHALYLISALVH